MCHQVVAEAVIEHSKAGAQDCLWRIFRRTTDTPSDSDSRRKVGMVREFILSFETEPVAYGEIGADAPVVLSVQPCIEPIHADGGISNRAGTHGIFRRPETTTDQRLFILPICQTHHQLLVGLDSRELHAGAGAGGAGRRSLPGSKRKFAVEIRRFKVFVAVLTQPRSKLHEVFAQSHGSVVLKLVAI